MVFKSPGGAGRAAIVPTVLSDEPAAPNGQTAWLRDELLHLLSLSGTLAGLCITGVTLFHTMETPTYSSTIADDVLAIAALCFLICTYAIFLALRINKRSLAAKLEKFVDALFALALTGMVAAGLIMVYTVW